MPLPVDPARLLVFAGLSAVLSATPGPAVLFCIATGVGRGVRGVVLGVLGISLASAVWFVGAGLGLGALMTAAPWLFAVLTVFGIGYLAWLGARKVWSGLFGDPQAPGGGSVRPGRAALIDGFAVQLGNPKVVLFFSTVLPPFIDLHRPLAAQVCVLAAASLLIDAVGLGAYGVGGAALADTLRTPRGARLFALGSGALLLVAALLVGLSRL